MICHVEMRIAGEKQAVQEFVQMLKWEGGYSTDGLGQVLGFELDETQIRHCGQNVVVFGTGSAVQTLHAQFMDLTKPRTLGGETRRFGVTVQMFASAPDIGIQEHLLVSNGNVLVDENIQYREYCLFDMTEEQIQELARQTGSTKRQLMEHTDSYGIVSVGGFEQFGQYQDLTKYLPEKGQKTSFRLSLDAMIGGAEDKRTAGDNLDGNGNIR